MNRRPLASKILLLESGLKRTLILMVVTALCAGAFAQTQPEAKKPARARRQAGLPPELLKAEEAIARKDYASAEALLLSETTANPKDFRAWDDLGFVYQATDRAEQAVKAYEQSIAIDPSIAETHAALGTLQHSLGQDAAALDHLQKAASLKPTAQTWLEIAAIQQREDPAGAMETLRKASALEPNNPAPHLRAGFIYEDVSNWPEAEREYLAAQKLGSRDALPGLINVYQQSGKKAEAMSALREYLKSSPNDAQAHLQLGQILASQSQTDEAVRELHAASELGAKDPKLLRQVGQELSLLKKPAEAVQAFRKAQQLDPKSAETHFALASTLNQMNDFVAAEPEFIRALELNPRLVDAYGGLAIAASKNNHHALALKALDARAKLGPDNPATLFLRATSYDSLQQYVLAADAYHRFLEAANGGFPDQEWQARHRLIAIEPEGKKKK